MGSGKKNDSFGWIGQALVTAAIFALPIIAGHMYFSHTPLTPDQLTEVTGHIARWKVERQQTSGKEGGAPSDMMELTIHTVEHSKHFYISGSYYEDPKYFNATRFEHDVKKGDELVFTIKKEDAGLTGDGRISVFGLASKKAAYLTVKSAMAYDESVRRMALYLFIGSLALLALLLVVSRMFWRDRKKTATARKNEGTIKQ
jgi:hypothetical protein